MNDNNFKDITWRPYQLDCDKAIQKNLKKGTKRQLIVEGTGLGKRLQSVWSSRHYNRILFIAHTEELIQQAYEDFELFFPMQCGIIKGPRFDIDKRIIIASAQTLWRRLDKMPKDMFDYVIADEVHHYLSKTFLLPLNHFEPELFTGWTATPTRLDGLNFSNIVDGIIHDYPLEDGIKDHWLSEIDAIRVKTNIDLKGVKKQAGDFNNKELSNRVDCRGRNQLIVNRYKEHGRGLQGVCFCVNIEHAENMKYIFNENGISAETIHSKISKEERTRINREFKNGDIQILTNVNVLTEGWDYADIGVLMMARPTMSLSLYMQMIGRASRLKSLKFIEKATGRILTEVTKKLGISLDRFIYNKGKIPFYKNKSDIKDMTDQELHFYKRLRHHSRAIILDFVDNTGNHSLINTWELDKKKKAKNKSFVSEEKRTKLIDAEETRAREIKNLYNDDVRVDLLKLPEIRIISSARMLEEATGPQVDWLKRGGVWQEDVTYTKAQASEFISNFECQHWQLQKLATWGFDVSNGATIGQFQEAQRQSGNQPEKNKKQAFKL